MKRKYYDLETSDQYPQYCDMKLCGILTYNPGAKDDGEVKVWEEPFTDEKLAEIQKELMDCDERIGFNCLNFDNIVLENYGIKLPEKGTHDAFIAVKTCLPGLPSYSLKFLNWLLLGDPHWPEFNFQQTGQKFGDEISSELREYHRWDLTQHKNIWEFILPYVVMSRHYPAYQLDMRMGKPLLEMTFEGGVLVDVEKAKKTLDEIAIVQEIIQKNIIAASGGKIINANSNKQVGKYLAEIENLELALTNTGEFQVKKKDLADIIGLDEKEMRSYWKSEAPKNDNISLVALLAWQMRDLETNRKYVHNYHTAAVGTNRNGWIPTAYSISSAGTRRTLSKSYYKINFQNSTEEIDEFKLIPPGYLGWFIDSTQVENVVHIYESEDDARREAYEADPFWNEYVWLTNQVMGTNLDKDALDKIKSKQVPHWSVYKLYKTVKLALNFGMGVKKFCKTLGLDEDVGRGIFNDIHAACPAIRQLQRRVEGDLQREKYVTDSFGHIYTGPPDEAYKVVAYLIQGCGTSSLPKAQIRANYDTIKWWEQQLKEPVGPLTSTTHDECSGLISLKINKDNIREILNSLYINMTEKFSGRFDGIPLRAKLYLSTTNWKDRKDNEVKDLNKITIP